MAPGPCSRTVGPGVVSVSVEAAAFGPLIGDVADLLAILGAWGVHR